MYPNDYYHQAQKSNQTVTLSDEAQKPSSDGQAKLRADCDAQRATSETDQEEAWPGILGVKGFV